MFNFRNLYLPFLLIISLLLGALVTIHIRKQQKQLLRVEWFNDMVMEAHKNTPNSTLTKYSFFIIKIPGKANREIDVGFREDGVLVWRPNPQTK